MAITESEITIEQLLSFSPKDAESIKQLVKKLGSSYQPLTDKNLKEILASPTTYLYAVREEKIQQIIGMATLAIYRIPYVKKAYLDDFIIDENYRGQGIGTMLIKIVLTKAKKEGASHIEFTSDPKRIVANKFYQKLGFEKRDTNVYRLNLTHA